MTDRLRLTDELVRLATRVVEDEGPLPGLAYMTDADYDDAIAGFLRDRPQGPIEVFACGSLIWRPAYEPVATRRATAAGWRRSFSLRIGRYRATRDRPGLMMQLDRAEGAAAVGLLHRLDPGREAADLATLWRREMPVKPPGNLPRWIEVMPDDGRTLRALAFTSNPAAGNYVGALDPDEAAEMIAGACGYMGSCAEYLMQTVAALAAHGIVDPYLDDLDARVAARLDRLRPREGSPLTPDGDSAAWRDSCSG